MPPRCPMLSMEPTVHISLRSESGIACQHLIDVGIDTILLAVRSDDLSEPLLGKGGGHGQSQEQRFTIGPPPMVSPKDSRLTSKS